MIGTAPLADQLRILLRSDCGGWALHELPNRQTLLEVVEPILGHCTYNMLTREGYRTLEEVVATPEVSLMNFRNLGAKSIALMRDAAAAYLAASAMSADETTGSHGAAVADLDTMTTDQLPILWAATVWELQRRGVLIVATTTDKSASGGPP